MEANANKCHFLVSTEEKLNANIPNYIVTNSDKEKLLGVTIGNLLKFETRIKNTCAAKPTKSCMHSLDYHHMWTLISVDW